MKKPPLWDISFRLPDDESVPPRFLILDLETQALAQWIATVIRLQVLGDALSGGSVFTHSGGVREFRGNLVRMFYKCLPGYRIEIIGWLVAGQGDDGLREILR